ncbi:MAG: PQQ-binding-like beta-propeller repeat protein, partial [bacterium]
MAHFKTFFISIKLFILWIIVTFSFAEDWLQFKYNPQNSGNVPERSVTTPLGLLGAVPLTDAVLTAPVVKDGRVYAVDASGMAFCIDVSTMAVVWKFQSAGGKANCNNVSSPAIAGNHLHFGTMYGSYYVLKISDGSVVKEIRTGDPIFSAPAISDDRVYFSTFGSRIYALNFNGDIIWKWDYLFDKLVVPQAFFRWNGEKGARLGKYFMCVNSIAVNGRSIILPTGSHLIWLSDDGSRCSFIKEQMAPNMAIGNVMSMDESGNVYWEFHGEGPSFEWFGVKAFYDKLNQGFEISSTLQGGSQGRVPSYCSVSSRDRKIYRSRAQEGFGLIIHDGLTGETVIGTAASIAPAIILDNTAVYGGLDGNLYVVPLSGTGEKWSFATGFGKPISAPAAVCDGNIFFGGEDGYLYILAPGGNAPLPTKDLELWKIRSGLTGNFTNSEYDWFSAMKNFQNINSAADQVRTPIKMKWIRQYKGTGHDPSVCGGGRIYTHTSEGQT